MGERGVLKDQAQKLLSQDDPRVVGITKNHWVFY